MYQRRGDVDEGHKGYCKFVVACRNATKLFELPDEALDTIAFDILGFVQSTLDDGVAPHGYDWLHALCLERLANLLAVVRFIGDCFFRSTFGRHFVEQFVEGCGIVALAGRQHDGNRRRFVGGGEVELAGEPAPTSAKSLALLAPFFWGAPAA